MGHIVKHEGRTYEIMLSPLYVIGRKKQYTAAQIAADETLLSELLEKAWAGRDEFNFDTNGIFKLLFEPSIDIEPVIPPAADVPTAEPATPAADAGKNNKGKQ